MKHFASPRFWRHYRQLPIAVQKLADKNFELLKADPHHPSLYLKRLRRFGRFVLALIIEHFTLINLKLLSGFGSARTPIITSSSNRMQPNEALAADGAIACFSSDFFLLSLDADRAPQLKRGVRLLLLKKEQTEYTTWLSALTALEADSKPL